MRYGGQFFVWGSIQSSDERYCYGDECHSHCVGGRSLYWGGWSPELLQGELPSPPWPQPVLDDLRAATLPDGSNGYFRQASDQIGTSQTNDFIFGDLHRAAREQLFAGVQANHVTDLSQGSLNLRLLIVYVGARLLSVKARVPFIADSAAFFSPRWANSGLFSRDHH
jgi:hypothetical protein